MAPTSRALPLPDELIENILVRVASPRELAFASVAHPDFRRIIAGASFPRLYRSLHPPQLLGILGVQGIMPAEAPHPNAPVARALVGDADFSYDHLPDAGGAYHWRPSDVRDGRVLLKRSVPHTDSVLVPTCDDAMAVVFIYSSLSGIWAVGTAASWDVLGFGDVVEQDDWFPSYAYGCFYCHVPERNKLLRLNIDRMEFSAVGLPPDYANRWVFAVEAGEGRVGIFTRTFVPDIPRVLQYSIRQNEGENAIEHSKETTILLPSDCIRYIVVTATEGYVFLLGGPSREPASGFFTLEIKTLKVERLCSPIGHDCAFLYPGYFGYPRFLSPRRI
ncbi:hypothetical protein HU200_054360 [Digitaria exilis]|uniref:F-box domain-containing protein n=1 Tax=Digitaria exilis TaxID=1010633 RepID=A0A835AMK0_9POAL|nr:hypothetical protein HU200_054360 [Digitaria exilis]